METNTIIKEGVTYVVPDSIPQAAFYKELFQTWEPETFEVFKSLKPGKLALDLGAWIGPTAIWLASKFDKVVAFEPDGVAMTSLREVVQATGASNIELVEAAVTDREGLSLSSRGDWGNSQSFLSTSGAKPVNTVMIQKLREIYSPDFIKCDIEGGEGMILTELLKFPCPILLSFHLTWWTVPFEQSHKDALEARSPGAWDTITTAPFSTLLIK